MRWLYARSWVQCDDILSFSNELLKTIKQLLKGEPRIATDDGTLLELIVYLLYEFILCEEVVGIFCKRKTKKREGQQPYFQKQAADRLDLQGLRIPTPAPELRMHFTF